MGWVARIVREARVMKHRIRVLWLVWWPILLKLSVAAVACVGFARLGRASLPHLGPPGMHATSGNAGLRAVKRPAVSTSPEVRLVASAPSKPRCPPCPNASTSSSGAVLADGRILINQATSEQLVRLPGVGRKRAEAIVALRGRLGAFRSLRQLMRVRGIGPRLVRRLKPHVVLERRSPKSKSAVD